LLIEIQFADFVSTDSINCEFIGKTTLPLEQEKPMLLSEMMRYGGGTQAGPFHSQMKLGSRKHQV
jgi:hypothetical protein